jgi:hypothetical protein
MAPDSTRTRTQGARQFLGERGQVATLQGFALDDRHALAAAPGAFAAHDEPRWRARRLADGPGLRSLLQPRALATPEVGREGVVHQAHFALGQFDARIGLGRSVALRLRHD